MVLGIWVFHVRKDGSSSWTWTYCTALLGPNLTKLGAIETPLACSPDPAWSDSDQLKSSTSSAQNRKRWTHTDPPSVFIIVRIYSNFSLFWLSTCFRFHNFRMDVFRRSISFLFYGFFWTTFLLFFFCLVFIGFFFCVSLLWLDIATASIDRFGHLWCFRRVYFTVGWFVLF